jgi:hypothetical protein
MSHEASPAGFYFFGANFCQEKKKKVPVQLIQRIFFLLKLCQSRQISTAKILKLL